MTPQELHAIYAPAWAACPECRPDGLELVRNEGAVESTFHQRAYSTDYRWMTSAQLTARGAAALCFEAAWVWLKARNYENFGSEHYPTHHHAVVAAVLAVCRGLHA